MNMSAAAIATARLLNCRHSACPRATLCDDQCRDAMECVDQFPGGPDLTPHEKEILTHLIQECGETIQAATKLMLFGREARGFPGDTKAPYDNVADLSRESGQLQHMLDECERLGMIDAVRVMEGMKKKAEQYPRYLRHKR